MSTNATENVDLFIVPDEKTIHVKRRDGETWMQFRREGLLALLDDNFALRNKVMDLEPLANRASPERFLPKLIADLEHRASTVGAPRDEAYAMAALLIRKAIGEDARKP